MSLRMRLAGLLGVALIWAGPALAAEPYCQIEQTCLDTPDNCAPAEGRVMLEVLQDGKAQVRVNGEVMGAGAILSMSKVTMLIFTTGDGVQNQVRIQEDGAFTYLISKPDAAAFNGKDQILYRGQCVEG